MKIHTDGLSKARKPEEGTLPRTAQANAVKPTEGRTLPAQSQKSRKQLTDTRSNIDVRAYREAVNEQRLALEKEMEEIIKREDDFDNPFSFRDLTNTLALR